ncbi:peptidoglycan-binding protein [Micromonospora carbonacea]|uniref:peptidoglycan-binding protein n=1 Tax=Micromonospora carbonacea TaxID=47853 RepID=UPI00371CA915
MSGWRLARSLEVLRAEVDAAAPGRSRASDGTIGDQAHAARASDHNPNAAGVVCGMDLTHDPAHGADMHRIAEHIRTRRHPALKYVIWSKRIASASSGWAWRPYAGSNPHDKHAHISVGTGPDGKSTGPYDDTSPWGLATNTGRFTMFAACKKGDQGEHVKALQVALEHLGHLPSGASDGKYGEQTAGAVLAMRKSTGSSAKSGDVFDAWGHMQLLICVARKYGAGQPGPRGPEGPRGPAGERGPVGPPGTLPAQLSISGMVTATAPAGAP